MLKSRVLTGALVTGAFVVASMFAAAPANAAPLPAGQQITVLNSESGQFYFANNNTAAQTAVGSGNPIVLDGDYLTGIDVDDTGLGYAIATYYPDGAAGAYLYSADANTGVLDYIDSIYFNFGDFSEEMDECTGIDYTDGVLMLACHDFEEEEEGDRGYIGVWDFDLGEAIPLIELTGDPDIDEDDPQFPNEPDNGFDFKPISAIAIDPISGLIYVFTQEFDPSYKNGIYTASEDAGLTDVSDTDNYEINGADFDRGGQLWVTTYVFPIPTLIPENNGGLATVNPADGTVPFSEPWADQEESIDPITVWGGLPATGPADSTAVVVGGAALLLFGAILAVGATARRRATES